MRKIFLVLLSLSILISASQLFIQIMAHQQRPVGFLGDQFIGLEKVLKDEKVIGYYTDKDLDGKITIAQFEQAQYILAPIILDLNQTNHRFVILDCTSPEIALEKIKEFGLQPLTANSLGVVLAVNPHVGISKS